MSRSRVRIPYSPLLGRLAQLVRAPLSHGGGQQFESVAAHFLFFVSLVNDEGFFVCNQGTGELTRSVSDEFSSWVCVRRIF